MLTHMKVAFDDIDEVMLRMFIMYSYDKIKTGICNHGGVTSPEKTTIGKSVKRGKK